MRQEIPVKEWASVQAQLETTCPKCGAPSGYWCHAPSGGLKPTLHRHRYWAAMTRLKAEMRTDGDDA